LTPKETITFEELFISNVYKQEALVNLLQKVRSHLEDKVFKTVIPNNITLGDAPSFGKTIFEYRPDSHGAGQRTIWLFVEKL